jgi:hypothetical protein
MNDFKTILKLIIKLLAIAFSATAFGWFIGTIVVLKMSCGG